MTVHLDTWAAGWRTASCFAATMSAVFWVALTPWRTCLGHYKTVHHRGMAMRTRAKTRRITWAPIERHSERENMLICANIPTVSRHGIGDTVYVYTTLYCSLKDPTSLDCSMPCPLVLQPCAAFA
jgi:hypothetical protein